MRIFLLILTVSSKPIPDAFHKSSGIVLIFTEEDLELFIWYNIIHPYFLSVPAFVLCPAGANAISEKRRRKRVGVDSVGSNRIEMIFTLLVEPIIVQIQFSKI